LRSSSQELLEHNSGSFRSSNVPDRTQDKNLRL